MVPGYDMKSSRRRRVSSGGIEKDDVWYLSIQKQGACCVRRLVSAVYLKSAADAFDGTCDRIVVAVQFRLVDATRPLNQRSSSKLLHPRRPQRSFFFLFSIFSFIDSNS